MFFAQKNECYYSNFQNKKPETQEHFLYKSLKKLVWNKGQSALLPARFAKTQETHGEVFLHNNHLSFLCHLGPRFSIVCLYVTHSNLYDQQGQGPNLFHFSHRAFIEAATYRTPSSRTRPECSIYLNHALQGFRSNKMNKFHKPLGPSLEI